MENQASVTPPPMPPDPTTLRTAEEFRAAASVLWNRMQWIRQQDVTFGGRRNMTAILGYKEILTNLDHRTRYERGGLAGTIVDVLPDAAWRGEMEVREDKDASNDTKFEEAWKAFDTKLQVQAKLLRVNKLSRLSNYACLLLGDGQDLQSELSRGDGSTDKIIYLRPLSGGGGPVNSIVRGAARTVANDAQCSIKELERDSTNFRFGLPKFYQLNGQDLDASEIGRAVHWSRIIHVAEGCLEDDIYGMPALERVWNLFDDLLKVTGGGSEAFWLRANAGIHMDVDKDLALPPTKPGEKSELEKMKEQAEDYANQMTRMMRTRGVSVTQLGSDVANFTGPADAIITQIAGAKRIPKRILTGSEMGQLASSEDRDNWRDQVNGYQTQQLGPYLVRQLIDRLLTYNYLPPPAKGLTVYEVVWPHMQTMTAEERDKRAIALATANKTQGTTLFTDSEIRDMSHGLAPLAPEDAKPITQLVREVVANGDNPNDLKIALRALEEAIESGDISKIDEILAVTRG